MKNLILAGFFLVTWNQYEAACITADTINPMLVPICTDSYTIETTTHTIKLATEEDVGKFIGVGNHQLAQGTTGYFGIGYGIISKDAFNIKVEELK